MSIAPIAPVSFEGLASVASGQNAALNAPAVATPGAFANLLSDGIADVEGKIARADKVARAFVLDDSIPVHQVTFALEEARMSLELMMQVRARIIESYQQLMTTQL